MAFLTAIATAIGTWFAGLGVWAQIGVRLGAGLAFNALSRALAGQPPAPRDPGFVGEIQLGSEVVRSFIMGRRYTAGSLVYHNQWGGTDNQFYTRVTALSDLPITDLVEIVINGVTHQLDKGNAHADYGWPIIGLERTFIETRQVVIGTNPDHDTPIYGTEDVEVTEPLGWVRFVDGTQVLADSFLINNVATTERPWTSDEVGVGVAHAILTLKWDRDRFQGPPQVGYVVDGIDMVDPDGVYGHSENPIVQVRTLMKGLTYSGTWFYGPETPAPLDDTEIIAEIQKCKADVPGAASMTVQERKDAFGGDFIPERYRSSVEVQINRPVADVIEDILAACNGRVSHVGTHYRVQVGDPGTSVASITDDDIRSNHPQGHNPFFPLAETVNAITATYPDPTQSWEMQDAPPLYRPALEVEDGDRRLPTSVQLTAVPFKEQVQRIMNAALDEARRARRHSHVLPSSFGYLEVGDFIDWTSDRFGYSAKLFRLDAVGVLETSDIQVDLTEVDPSDYTAWDAKADFQKQDPGAMSAYVVTSAEVTDWAVEPATADDGDGPRRPALALLWTPPARGIHSGLIWQVRDPVNQHLVAEGVAGELDMGLALVTDQALVRNTTYEARGKLLTPGPSTWSAWVSATTPDVGFKAADLDVADGVNLLVNSDFSQGTTHWRKAGSGDIGTDGTLTLNKSGDPFAGVVAQTLQLYHPEYPSGFPNTAPTGWIDARFRKEKADGTLGYGAEVKADEWYEFTAQMLFDLNDPIVDQATGVRMRITWQDKTGTTISTSDVLTTGPLAGTSDNPEDWTRVGGKAQAPATAAIAAPTVRLENGESNYGDARVAIYKPMFTRTTETAKQSPYSASPQSLFQSENVAFSDVTISDGGTIDGGLTVNDAATVNDGLTVNDGATLNGTVTIPDDATISDRKHDKIVVIKDGNTQITSEASGSPDAVTDEVVIDFADYVLDGSSNVTNPVIVTIAGEVFLRDPFSGDVVLTLQKRVGAGAWSDVTRTRPVQVYSAFESQQRHFSVMIVDDDDLPDFNRLRLVAWIDTAGTVTDGVNLKDITMVVEQANKSAI